MGSFSQSHFTLRLYCISLLLLPSVSSINVTAILSSYPDLSDFAHLLFTTTVADDLLVRSSLTVLAVPNRYLRPLLTASLINHHHSYSDLADTLRYHVLLQYLSWPELNHLPTSGKIVTTLFQTTGRATTDLGSVNLTRNPNDGIIKIQSPSASANILSLVFSLPYNITIFTINSLLVPDGFDLTASENRPPLGLNITKALIDGKNFNVAASMLIASGIASEFEEDEAGAGITVFVPTDSAFSELPSSQKFQSLPAITKSIVLKFHVLHSYYPLGSLESIVNPVQPTLATEDSGAGRFTLNITRVNGSVAIDTGIVQASITQTVFDQNPLAIFAVSKVLLPMELFGKEIVSGSRLGSGNLVTPPPEFIISPENPPYNSLGSVSSPPFPSEILSASGWRRRSITSLCFLCTGLYLLL